MEQAVVSSRIRLDEFEKFHLRRLVRRVPAVTAAEIAWTATIALFCSPFFFATFFLIPMMGQITVGLASFVTALYLWYRRSWLVAGVALGGGGFFAALTFAFIQSIKNNLEVPLFILIALGIPVTAMYTIFVAARIWIIRGGAE